MLVAFVHLVGVVLASTASSAAAAGASAGRVFSVREVGVVVAGLQQHYKTRCTFVVSSDVDVVENGPKFATIAKGVSRNLASTMMLRVSQLNHTAKQFNCPANRPLFVFLSSDQPSKRYLEAAKSSGFLYPQWLVFLDTNETVDSFFENIYVPFDVEFGVAERRDAGVVFTEVYRVRKGMPLWKHVFGSWTPGRGVTASSLELYTRRNNLHGLVMRASAIDNPPIISVKQNANGRTEIGGVLGDTWKALETKMNFTTEYRPPKDNYRGGRLANGTWTGVIAQIIREEIDVALEDFTMTLLRFEAVDFTLPLFLSSNRVYIRRPDTLQLVWNNFLAPFSSTLWFCIGASVLSLGVVLTSAYRVTRRQGQEGDGPDEFTLADCCLCILGLLCQQGQETTPQSGSCRIIFWTACLTSIVFYGAYAAALISSLTVQIIELPFSTFEELINDGSYKLGVLANSGHSNLLDTTSDALLRELYEKLVLPHPNTLPTSLLEGMRTICSEERFAFFTSKVAAGAISDQLECEIVDLPHASIPDNEGFILPKGSPFKNILSYNLMSLRNCGVFSRIRRHAMPRTLDPTDNHQYGVSIWQLVPIFTIVASGVVFATAVLSVELLVQRRLAPRRQKPRAPAPTRGVAVKRCRVVAGLTSVQT